MHSPCVCVELWWAIMVQSSYAMINITLSYVPAYWYVGKVGPAICISTISAAICTYVTSKRMILSKNMSLSKRFYIWISDNEHGTFTLQFLSALVYQWLCEIVCGSSDQHLSCVTNSYRQAVGWSCNRAPSTLVVFDVVCTVFEGLYQICLCTVTQNVVSAVYPAPPESCQRLVPVWKTFLTALCNNTASVFCSSCQNGCYDWITWAV